jgi:RNA polymerase sigma factor (TIGR02999 family)
VPEDPSKNITAILHLAGTGDRRAAEDLLPMVYGELRAMAQKQLSHESKSLTLQATALVHEAFMRLGDPTQIKWESRRHFFGAAAQAMRRILIERARKYAGPKAGGGRARVPLTDSADPKVAAEETVDWVALDAALEALEREDQELAEIVRLRYFAGLSIDQTAEVMNVSARTVDRNWKVARAFLARQLMQAGEQP